MNPKLRPLPHPWPTGWWKEYRRLLAAGWLPWWARQHIQADNAFARSSPGKGELCGAKTRTGEPCKRKAGIRGRCPNHGEKSTGAKTPEGRARALSNLRQFRK